MPASKSSRSSRSSSRKSVARKSKKGSRKSVARKSKKGSRKSVVRKSKKGSRKSKSKKGSRKSKSKSAAKDPRLKNPRQLRFAALTVNFRQKMAKLEMLDKTADYLNELFKKILNKVGHSVHDQRGEKITLEFITLHDVKTYKEFYKQTDLVSEITKTVYYLNNQLGYASYALNSVYEIKQKIAAFLDDWKNFHLDFKKK